MTRLPAIVPLGFGLLIGLLVGAFIAADTAPSPNVVAAPQESPESDRVAGALETANALQLTAMATATVTPIPTLEPTPYTKRVTINECGTATPGATCEWPNPTPLPPTPFPLCGPEMKGGMTCVWPTTTVKGN